MLAALPEGTLFARRYRVVQCIACGGMGAVYEVEHLETARRRALKVMHPHLFQSQEMRERFQREARIGANIQSDHIVDVFDAGVDEATGMPFLVMELLRGEELGKRVKRLGRLPVGEALLYLQQTAVTLDRTHAASIVHRDLKPENLFITYREDGSPVVKILDFGVAKLVAEGSSAGATTQSVGTPLYMAPEQLFLGTKLTGAADIYALGMMTYTLLVGEAYWAPEAKNAREVIAFALVAVKGPQEPPVQRAAVRGVVLPPAFDAWFAKVTASEPEARFKTAVEAIGALREVLGSGQAAMPAGLTPVPGTTPPGAFVSGAATPTTPTTPTTPATPATPVGVLDRAATSTSASVSKVSSQVSSQRSSGMASVVAAGAAAAVVAGGLAGGIWYALRPASTDKESATAAESAAAPPAAPAAATATATATESATAKESATATVTPSGTAAPNPEPTVTPGPTTTPSAAPPVAAKPTTTSRTGAAPAGTTTAPPPRPTTTSTLLGRD